MADIFSRAGQDFKGSFAADAARVAFAGGSADLLGVGLLTQTISVNYTQALTRLYEIGTNYTYIVAGRTAGQLAMGRVLGPRPIQLGFYAKYGNVCNAATNNLNFEAETGCPTGENPGNTGGLSGTYTFGIRNAVITNIAITVSAQDMIINEQLQMMFVSLNLDNG